MTKYDTKLWRWGSLQWGHEIKIITPEAEAELQQIKLDNPNVDFEKLAQDVRTNQLKPR